MSDGFFKSGEDEGAEVMVTGRGDGTKLLTPEPIRESLLENKKLPPIIDNKVPYITNNKLPPITNPKSNKRPSKHDIRDLMKKSIKLRMVESYKAYETKEMEK